MISNATHLAMLKSPRQKIQAGVEIYEGSTLVMTCSCSDVLESFTVEREGQGKFFGYGVVHKLKVNLIDVNRTINLTPANTIKIGYTVDGNTVYPYPIFNVRADGISRDEGSNTLTITAYDALADAVEHKFDELTIEPRIDGSGNPYYYLDDYLDAVCKVLGVGSSSNTAVGFGRTQTVFPNFDGTENLREVLDALAEATTSIYYLNYNTRTGGSSIRFTRINSGSVAATIRDTIDNTRYYTLANNGTTTLGNVCHATELGDNVISTPEGEGITQYVRDNPFWEAYAASDGIDIGAEVNRARDYMTNIPFANFEMEWGGNYLLEIR